MYIISSVLTPITNNAILNPGGTLALTAVAALSSSNSLTLMSQLVQASPNISALLADDTAQYTIFAPSDDAIR
jgi:hypothetical protein